MVQEFSLCKVRNFRKIWNLKSLLQWEAQALLIHSGDFCANNLLGSWMQCNVSGVCIGCWHLPSHASLALCFAMKFKEYDEITDGGIVSENYSDHWAALCHNGYQDARSLLVQGIRRGIPERLGFDKLTFKLVSIARWWPRIYHIAKKILYIIGDDVLTKLARAQAKYREKHVRLMDIQFRLRSFSARVPGHDEDRDIDTESMLIHS